METEELIEHILRQKHLEEMMKRPEKEHTPIEGMDNEQIKRFALFLFEENQSKSKQIDEMIARLDEIGKDLKESNKKIDLSLIHIFLPLINTRRYLSGSPFTYRVVPMAVVCTEIEGDVYKRQVAHSCI